MTAICAMTSHLARGLVKKRLTDKSYSLYNKVGSISSSDSLWTSNSGRKLLKADNRCSFKTREYSTPSQRLPNSSFTIRRNMSSSSPILSEILDIVNRQNLVSNKFDKNCKVIEFIHPEVLGDQLGGLEIGVEGTSETRVKEIVEKVVKYSAKTCSPYFYNQLYHGVDEYGLAGSWLSDALNTNNHTFEVAPVFIVVEREVIKWMKMKFGFSEDMGDGIFSPGGSLSNMYGMVLARYQKFPEIKTKGMIGGDVAKPLVAFTSEEAHYSISKAAGWLGIGTENVVKVKTDQRGRMIPDELSSAIGKTKSEGKIPFFVNCTSGTTVMGAFDPLRELIGVCREHEVWAHVDACWGGTVILSEKHKHLMDGSELADSIAWNPHKMLGAPLQTSPFITRHKGLLHRCNSASATYLFQQDKFYDVSYDTGDKSVQCGRKVDAFKFWFMLKARGEKFCEDSVDNCMAQAEYLQELVEKTEGFEPAFAGFLNCTNVCFHYLPTRFRNRTKDEEFWSELSLVPPKIKESMIKKGSLMIGYQPLPHKGMKNFFRMVIHATPAPTKEDMEYVIREIDQMGKDL